MLLGVPDCQLAADLPDAPSFSRGEPRLSVGCEPPPNGRCAPFPPVFLSASLFLGAAFSGALRPGFGNGAVIDRSECAVVRRSDVMGQFSVKGKDARQVKPRVGLLPQGLTSCCIAPQCHFNDLDSVVVASPRQ